jgi:uncharacterized membrane protein
MTDIRTIEAEREDLRTHVELCSQRYQAVDQRLARIERVLWALLAVAATSGGPVVATYLPTLLRAAGGG